MIPVAWRYKHWYIDKYIYSEHGVPSDRVGEPLYSYEQMKELIEAAKDIPIEYNYHGNPATPEWKRFVDALEAIRAGGDK